MAVRAPCDHSTACLQPAVGGTLAARGRAFTFSCLNLLITPDCIGTCRVNTSHGQNSWQCAPTCSSVALVTAPDSKESRTSQGWRHCQELSASSEAVQKESRTNWALFTIDFSGSDSGCTPCVMHSMPYMCCGALPKEPALGGVLLVPMVIDASAFEPQVGNPSVAKNSPN